MSEERLEWARRLQAVAQNGLAYTEGTFDRERYEQIRAIASEIMASSSEDSSETAPRFETLFAEQAGYATPKLDIRSVVLDEEYRVLLVREKEDGLWTLPGGWVDVGDSPSESAEREVKEESGYEVRVERLLALLNRDNYPHPPHPFHMYKLYVLCALTGGEAVTETVETSGVGFFDVEDLPPMSEGRTLPDQVRELVSMACGESGGAALD